ncbi:MAG: MlaD family protein, partial [Acidobacteriota bacterium]|nr:MlaD family protein [Acidobacteriota bacterium]
MSLKSPELRVGAVVLTALVILLAAVLLVGEQDHLFSQKNEYFIRFPNVLGLTPGNPVQLSGVNVGRVDRIVVPDEIEKQMLEVWISVDERYAQRLRTDSQASIKTLGLLGDKYIEITSGTATAEELPSGAEIETAPTTELDELLASGGDMMDNLVAISVSLKDLLVQIQSGEGYLGALIATPGPGEPTAQEMRADLAATLHSFSLAASALENGDGTLPRLINDPNLANRLDASLERLEGILADVSEGDGMLPMML